MNLIISKRAGADLRRLFLYLETEFGYHHACDIIDAVLLVSSMDDLTCSPPEKGKDSVSRPDGAISSRNFAAFWFYADNPGASRPSENGRRTWFSFAEQDKLSTARHLKQTQAYIPDLNVEALRQQC